jgi:NADH-quinone oxidoreductase subunit I
MPGKVVNISAREQTFFEKIYLVEVAKGLARTLGHFLANAPRTLIHEIPVIGKKLVAKLGIPTIHYPEQRRNYSERFRGRHILKKREDETLKCVACYMCETACPAECIHIEAGEHPKLAYEKYPVVFEIDLLRCVMCGFCVDACPKDAIWMTRDYELSFFTRESAIYGIPELTEKPSDTAPGGPGYGYRPYYGDSPMKKAGEFQPSGLALLPILDLRAKAINRMPPPASAPKPAPVPAAKPAA